jgi:uncharacterized protein
MEVMNPVAANCPGQRRSWKRTLAGWILKAGAVYLGVIIVLSALENWMVYHPIPATEEWFDPVDFGLNAQDVELHTAEGTRLHAWWCPVDPANSHPPRTLLYCHGNAGNLSHRGFIIPNWQKYLNVSVLIFDYPGYGKSAGKPNEQQCYAAADAAYDWLTQTKNVPPEQLLIYGGSLGGGVAIDLASRRPHHALIVAKSFTSLPDVGQRIYPWLPVRWVMRNRFNNLTKIGKCHQPVFITHGTADDLVPFVLSQRLYEAANEPKRFCILEGLNHNDPLPPTMFQELREFLERHESRAAVTSKTPPQ